LRQQIEKHQQTLSPACGSYYIEQLIMNTTDPKKPEETQLPDFVETNTEAKGFGDTDNTEAEQESFPDNGYQTITEATTGDTKLDIEPNEDGDGSIAGVND
jgi:hypothetical protein